MKLSKIVQIGLILIGLLSIIYFLVYFLIFKDLNTRFSTFGTSPILDRGKVSLGYTLIAPYNRFTKIGPEFEDKIYLLDLLGRPVHIWKTKHQALYAVLKPNGNLLVVLEQPKYIEGIPPGGNTGIVEELDWNSNVIWEYKNEMAHHDIVPLPNGNVVVALWEKTPPEIAQKVQGGVLGTELKGIIWSDNLVELNPKGEIVWNWHSFKHLDPAQDVIGQLLPRLSWTHTNGIYFMEKNPIDGEEGYLISMRSISKVMIVRKRDGEIIWRSKEGLLDTQHDPTLLPNGNILVFDNGYYRIPQPFSLFGSRVVEIDPEENKIVWQVDGGEGVIDKIKFFAPIVSGAQRLPNGNTLVTDGVRGHIFEVTQDQKLVWDFINPYTTKMTGHFPNNFLFKARRYSQNEINWPQKIDPPLNDLMFKIYQGLLRIYPN